MSSTVVIGAQWGDEGKGKIIDLLSAASDVIVRFQGGNNAGHTVVIDGDEFILHLIPSGILHDSKICIIGNGVVINPRSFLDEVEILKTKNINVKGRLFVSSLSHIIFPYHWKMDLLKEKQKGKAKIGTTKRGIGPCYSDKASRSGIRMVDLLNDAVFRKKLKDNLKEKNEIFKKVYNFNGFSFDDIYSEYAGYREKIKLYVKDTVSMVNKAIDNKRKVLFEGAQGTFLDVDFGTYPYVTSSNSTAGGVCSGSGVSPSKIDKVMGVVKAYTTRVGEGPFPTEFTELLMKKIRSKGNEFGATTKRPRRCGWFDAVLVKQAVMINNLKEVAVTKLDVLDSLKKIKICTGYSYKGRKISEFPSSSELLYKVKPIYREVPGWESDTTKAKVYKDLPQKAKKYLSIISDLINSKISIISVGSERKQTIRV